MDLDLRDAVQDIRDFIRKRVRAFKRGPHDGPGKPGDPITLITIGYQIDQAGWIALIFDTRPEPECDGEWQNSIERKLLPFPAWHRAFKTMTSGHKPIQVVLADGKAKTLRWTMSMGTVCAPFGKATKAALVGAWREGDFAALPLAKGCRLQVEEQEGQWGWTNLKARPVNRAKQHFDAIRYQLLHDAQGMTENERIAHWLAVVKQDAASPWGTRCFPYLLHVDACDQLAAIGEAAVMPTLDLLIRRADQPDPQQDKNLGAPFGAALRMVNDIGYRTAEVEQRLCELVQKSAAQYQAGHESWGQLADMAALYLSYLFDQYPQPIIGGPHLPEPELYVYRQRR